MYQSKELCIFISENVCAYARRLDDNDTMIMMEANNTTIAKLESTNDILVGNRTTVTEQL
jgi:hypothetical protein